MNIFQNLSSPVPADELEQRITVFQKRLCKAGIDLALIRQNSDLYYFTGTVQDGHLFIPSTGQPVMFVYRSYERARHESCLKNIAPLDSIKQLPSLLKERKLTFSSLGLEMDILPANLFHIYKKLFNIKGQIHDISPIIRQVRSVKSQLEISFIKKACKQVAKVVEKVPELFFAGMREIDLAASIEAEMRKLGHPGYLRIRGFNQELTMGQVLSGPEAALPSWTNTPAGGVGVCSAYGVNAGFRRVKQGDPLSVDLGGSLNGYLCDQTRLFSIGKVRPQISEFYKKICSIHDFIQALLKPDANCGEIYDKGLKKAETLGLSDYFMGFGRDKVNFIGHGVGIEIDEYPFLSRGSKMILEKGMVVAVEPKLLIPDIGLIGIEDTYLITTSGVEKLTLSPKEIRTL